MSMPRSPRGVDSITLGTIMPRGSITSRVSLIQRGSFGLNLLPIFAPFNISETICLTYQGRGKPSPYPRRSTTTARLGVRAGLAPALVSSLRVRYETLSAKTECAEEPCYYRVVYRYD